MQLRCRWGIVGNGKIARIVGEGAARIPVPRAAKW